jgi:hypothetical protein
VFFLSGKWRSGSDVRQTASLLVVGMVLAEFEAGVLFENCTVDASIFVVSNEERTVDALAPGADEGRRRLR